MEQPGEGYDAVYASLSYTLGANVEELDLIGSANLSGTGNELNNTIVGNSGIDTLIGNGGHDSYIIHNSATQIIETTSGGIDTVYSDVSFTAPANVENLLLFGYGNIDATGNSLANVLYGNSGDNLLNGRAGADYMAGGAGNDSYVVDDFGDVVVEQPGEGYDVVYASLSYTLGANEEQLFLIGTDDINGTGNSLDNVIFGNGGDNVLSGGLGHDTFVFLVGSGTDTIVDFDPTVDTLAFSQSLFSSSADVLSHASQDNQGDTLISNADTTIVLKGVSYADFQTYHGDFLFL